jgi:hypothetical protein
MSPPANANSAAPNQCLEHIGKPVLAVPLKFATPVPAKLALFWQAAEVTLRENALSVRIRSLTTRSSMYRFLTKSRLLRKPAVLSVATAITYSDSDQRVRLDLSAENVTKIPRVP